LKTRTEQVANVLENVKAQTKVISLIITICEENILRVLVMILKMDMVYIIRREIEI